MVTIVPAPEIAIVKSVTPPSRPEPGGAFTYDLLITNPGPIDIVITSLVTTSTAIWAIRRTPTCSRTRAMT